VTPNPYAPPTARVADLQRADEAPAIWNPNAAANWSLLFSPAFGAFLHMLNWRALGEPEKAASAKNWFIASLVMLVVYVLVTLSLADTKAADGATRGLGLAYLFVWYFAVARGQANYVKDRFGKAYPRKGWGKPLLIALLAMIGYVVFAGAVGVVFGIVRNA
jgi:small-conductance mechanosensitive channel